jgi:flagellar basal-body rod modification protein FlgD
MSINNVSSILDTISSQSSTTETKDSDSSASMMDFITIFLAQLQYQDPLNPMEGTEMTSQLAQITTVEQLYNTNEKLDIISQGLDSLSSAQFLEYIGKDILMEGNELPVQDGETQGWISFSLENPAQVEIIIFDADGNEIQRIQHGETQAGSHQVEWDGKDAQGNTVEDGYYSYTVSATDDNGDPVTVETQARLMVTGLTYYEGTPYLLTGERLVDPEKIICVYDRSS